MKIFNTNIKLKPQDYDIFSESFTLYFNNYFLDIETTGLNRFDDEIIIIGVMKLKSNHLEIKQWFSEKKSDERKILANFISYISSNSHIISFNGLSFDIGFLNTKLKNYNMPILNEHHIYTDIYRWSKNLKFDEIEDRKLKTLCDFFNIERVDDKASDFVRSYKLYRESKESKDTKLLDNMLLHNFEDVHNLFYLWQMNKYLDVNLHTKLLPRVNKHSQALKFMYHFELKSDKEIHICGILDLETPNKSRFINSVGTYFELSDRYFEMKLKLEKVIYENKTIYVVNILNIRDDLQVIIASNYSVIKVDEDFIHTNIEYIIEHMLEEFLKRNNIIVLK